MLIKVVKRAITTPDLKVFRTGFGKTALSPQGLNRKNCNKSLMFKTKKL